MAHALALENTHIRADVIEVQEFPFLGQRYQVTGVPKTVINERVQFLGAVPEQVFLWHLLKAIGKEPPEEDQRPGLS